MKIHGTAKGGALSKKDFGVAFGGGAASTCTEQLLTGQTAGLEAPIYDGGQQVGQQFTSDEWFGLSQITKAQFSLKRAASVDASLIIKCWLVNQADLDTAETLEDLAKGQLGGTINVGDDVGTSFGFVTFEGSGLPDPTVDDDILIMEASGTGTSGDITVTYPRGRPIIHSTNRLDSFPSSVGAGAGRPMVRSHRRIAGSYRPQAVGPGRSRGSVADPTVASTVSCSSVRRSALSASVATQNHRARR